MVGGSADHVLLHSSTHISCTRCFQSLKFLEIGSADKVLLGHVSMECVWEQMLVRHRK